VNPVGRREIVSLSGQNPHGYRRHALHATDRTYLESNCYSDIIIELLHARGYEPLAAFGNLVRMDFEGDQWTFFKPAPEDLERLFGVDIHEMQPYRALPEQIAEQLQAGRTIIVELDSWYLPDTASTSYRTQHVKTSVAADAIDLEGQTLQYFHSAGLYELSGEDYRGIFRIGADAPAALPPYTEVVRFDAGERLEGERLRTASLAALRHHLEHRPQVNPFEAFGRQLRRELPKLLDGDLEAYHAYAFATVRMAGSAFEIAADYARWLFGPDAGEIGTVMAEIVDGCKALSFRLARRRSFDPDPLIASLVDGWSRGVGGLAALAG
jgi:Domain of unknown function (DUF1839)